MPIYEYKCEECGRQFELLRRMSQADTDLLCPQCSSEKIRRLVSSFAAGGCGAPAGSGFR